MTKTTCHNDPNYSDLWIFLIETDSYTGNFDRTLSGFITGIPNEYEPEPAEDYCKTFGLNQDAHQDSGEDVYERMSNEYGHDIFSMFNCNEECNGLAIYFQRKPTQSEIDRMKARTLEFVQGNDRYGDKRNIKILKFRLIHRTVQVNEEELEL